MAHESRQPGNRLLRFIWLDLTAASRGIILIVGMTMLAAVMQVAVRDLSTELHPFQILFILNLIGAILFLPLIMRGGASLLKTRKLPLHLSKSVREISEQGAARYDSGI